MHFTPSSSHSKPLVPYTRTDKDKAQILVIEPDTNLRSLLECSIQAGHYLAIGVDDIDEAVAVLREKKFDLVLLSLSINATERLLPLTKLRHHWSGPTIVLSDSRAPLIRRQALSTTATAFLAKPVRLLELHQYVGNLLGARTILDG